MGLTHEQKAKLNWKASSDAFGQDFAFEPRMKAGATLVILAIGLVVVLIVIWSYVNIPIIKNNQLETDVETRTHIHTMGNALDAAKLYADTALDYSIYQACYDNLKKGGWESLPTNNYQGLAVWDSGSGPGQTLFEEGMQNSIKSNLNLYTKSTYKFLSEYFVNIPTYTQVYMNTDDADPLLMSVSAFADSNMNIQKNQETGEYIRLEKDSTLMNSDDYKVNCYGVYQKGVEIYGQLREDIEGFLVDAPVDNPTDFQKGLRQTILPGWETGGTNTWGEEGMDGSEYIITATILQDAVTQTSVGANPSDNIYEANIKVKLEIQNPTGNQFPVFDGSSVSMQPIALVYVLSITKPLPLEPAKAFKLAPKTQAAQQFTYSFQSAEEETCEDEDECGYVAECSISSYSEDGMELDEMDCPIEDPCCTEAVQVLREDNWTVEGSCCSGSNLPSGVLSFSIGKGKTYLKPAVPPKGTEGLQRIVSVFSISNQLPKPFVFSIVQAESSWRPNARSNKGAIGLMQIMPKTAISQGWKKSEGSLYNPKINVKYGAKYLRYLLDMFNGDERLAAAAYNAGPTRVNSILGDECRKNPTYDCAKRYLPAETINYVPKVTKYKNLYTALISSGVISV